MTGSERIAIEFTFNEARILCQSLSGFSPPKEDEMISFMLFARIKRAIEEARRDKDEV